MKSLHLFLPVFLICALIHWQVALWRQVKIFNLQTPLCLRYVFLKIFPEIEIKDFSLLQSSRLKSKICEAALRAGPG